MRNIVENYTPDANFWEMNPQFTVINPFVFHKIMY